MEDTNIETVVEEKPEVVEVIEAAPEVPELEYTYQPKDESGRPLGGRQVIKYRTSEELADKLAEQNTLLVRKLRQETRKNRLGVESVDEIPTDAPRFSQPVEFNPRQLSAEERIQLSRDLLDPDKFEEAQGTIFEATVGMKPAELGSTLKDLQSTNIRILAKTESDAFMVNNPDYFKCQENFEAITNWMLKNDLAPLRQNFQMAFDTLKKDDVILMAPEKEVTIPVAAMPTVVPPVEQVVVEEPVIKPEPKATVVPPRS